jgi:PTS system galactosamine-specific IIC component
MTTVIAFTTGIQAQTAIGLALPFSFLMQYIILFYYSSFSFFMVKADKYASEANVKAFVKLNILTTAIVALTYGLVVFLSTYVAQDATQMLVQAMPAWLTHGFEIAGGILPGVGFGMLLKVMLQKQHIPYLIIGFLFTSFIKFSNLLPIALLGTALAIYEYFNEKDKYQILSKSAMKGEDNNEGI